MNKIAYFIQYATENPQVRDALIPYLYARSATFRKQALRNPVAMVRVGVALSKMIVDQLQNEGKLTWDELYDYVGGPISKHSVESVVRRLMDRGFAVEKGNSIYYVSCKHERIWDHPSLEIRGAREWMQECRDCHSTRVVTAPSRGPQKFGPWSHNI